MYKIQLTARAKKELKLLSKKRKELIANILEEIKENPFLAKPLTRELTGKYSYRIGVYRIIYKIKKREKVVIILTIGHRSTVYN